MWENLQTRCKFWREGGDATIGSNNFDKYFITYTLLLVGILLYPYRFQYPIHTKENHAEWLSAENGIKFSTASEIRSKTRNDVFNSTLISGDGLSIEVWMATDDYQQKGPARIISYSFDPFFRNFTLEQEGRDLIFRLRTEETNLDGFPGTKLKNIFRSSDPYHVVVTYDYQRERIYINGRKLLEEPSIRGRFSNWDPSYPLLFGNENTGNRPWQGSIFLVAVYKQGLSAAEILRNYEAGRFYRPDEDDDNKHLKNGLIALYLFNEKGGSVIHDKSGYGLDIDLLIPDKVIVDDQKHFLEVYTPGPQNILDIMQNFIAFAIFGFLLNGFLRPRCHSVMRTFLFGIIIGAIFSFGSEAIEYYLDTRTSSLLDSLSRVSGVVFGMSIGIYTKYWNEKHKMHISRT